jgi:hypothetical protein
MLGRRFQGIFRAVILPFGGGDFGKAGFPLKRRNEKIRGIGISRTRWPNDASRRSR